MATRRTTQSTDEHPGEIKEVLNVISLKLDTINESIQQIIAGQQNDKRKEGETHQAIATSINKIQENISIVVNKSEKADLNREILKQRNNILTTWKGHLNKRKQLYWQSINCENTAIIYETWLNKETKIIPRKFLMKFIRNEDAAERIIRRNSIFTQFQSEIDLLRIRADRHSAKYKQVDQEMLSFLESNYHGDIIAELQNLWAEECKSEETKSHQKWQSKQKWLEKYEEDFNNNEYIKPRNGKPRNRHQEEYRQNKMKRQDNAVYQQQNGWHASKSSSSTRASPPQPQYYTNDSNRSKSRNTNITTRPRDTRAIPEIRHAVTRNVSRQQPSWRPTYTAQKPTYSEVVSRSHERRNVLSQQPRNNNQNRDHFFETSRWINRPPNHQQSRHPTHQPQYQQQLQRNCQSIGRR